MVLFYTTNCARLVGLHISGESPVSLTLQVVGGINYDSPLYPLLCDCGDRLHIWSSDLHGKSFNHWAISRAWHVSFTSISDNTIFLNFQLESKNQENISFCLIAEKKQESHSGGA